MSCFKPEHLRLGCRMGLQNGVAEWGFFMSALQLRVSRLGKVLGMEYGGVCRVSSYHRTGQRM